MASVPRFQGTWFHSFKVLWFQHSKIQRFKSRCHGFNLVIWASDGSRASRIRSFQAPGYFGFKWLGIKDSMVMKSTCMKPKRSSWLHGHQVRRAWIIAIVLPSRDFWAFSICIHLYHCASRICSSLLLLLPFIRQSAGQSSQSDYDALAMTPLLCWFIPWKNIGQTFWGPFLQFSGLTFRKIGGKQRFFGEAQISFSMCSLKPIDESMLPVSTKQVYLLILCICRTFAASKVRTVCIFRSWRAVWNLQCFFIYSFLNFETTDFHKFHQFSRCCGLVTSFPCVCR